MHDTNNTVQIDEQGGMGKMAHGKQLKVEAVDEDDEEHESIEEYLKSTETVIVMCESMVLGLVGKRFWEKMRERLR